MADPCLGDRSSVIRPSGAFPHPGQCGTEVSNDPASGSAAEYNDTRLLMWIES